MADFGISNLVTLLVPILSVTIGVFGYAIVKVLHENRQKGVMLKSMQYLGEQQLESVSKIDDGILNLRKSIDSAVVPQLSSVYQTLTADSVPLNGGALRDMIKGIGLERSELLGENVIVTGVKTPAGRAISIFLMIERSSSELIIRTHSIMIHKRPLEFLEKLLFIAETRKTGKIGLKKIGDKAVIMIDHTLEAPQNRVNREALQTSIGRLIALQEDVIQLANEFSAEPEELLAGDFLTLSNQGDIAKPASVAAST